MNQRLILKYSKIKKDTPPMRVSSVNITQEQKDFLDKHGINLSQLVRDSIETLRKPK